MTVTPLSLLAQPTRYLFFTGKGGVGKTSLAAACAIALADAGQRVLLVSTDAASNLDEMLGVPLRNAPVPVPGVPATPGSGALWLLNIDPDAAAEAYRARVLAQLEPSATDAQRGSVREQMSGACTTEIAAFDEFVALLAGGDGASAGQAYDHVVFDTAPTGHTLRLLSLPRAWSGFLAGNDRGASCLGPHSGLKSQEQRFNIAMRALADPTLTTVVLVVRPETTALAEAGRTAAELDTLGLTHQRLLVNAVFHASSAADAVAAALEAQGRAALAALPDTLRALPRDEVPLRPFDTVGLPSLRALLGGAMPPAEAPATGANAGADVRPLSALVEQLAAAGRGLVMVMGKGGVGKTTLAAALALGLVQRGHAVHLTTTDPAAHVLATLGAHSAVPGLRVSRIDPQAETRKYIEKVMASRSKGLDDAGRALLREDLRSPCTEEVAVFHAFAHVVNEARNSFVVMDTAPTGHSLLLMDATGAYHRQMTRELASQGSARIVTPLMRLQDAAYTQVIVVALPEPTPVLQAQALQEDLRRAGIEPYAWVLNRSLAATGTQEPLLRARLRGEQRQMLRIAGGLARKLFVVPWRPEPPVGVPALEALAAAPDIAAR
jgi:arsenite/tail-anchored protein-transporting ATPase